MDDIKCPDCGGSDLEKYGKTTTGKQKYKCLVPDCRRQFVAESDHRLSKSKKELILNLLEANVDPKQIAKAVPDISLRWIYELRRRMKNDQHSR